MKRISSTRDLPKEFDLEKYDILEGMSSKDLFRQLYIRKDPFTESFDCNWDDGIATYYLEYGGSLPMGFDEDPFGEIKIEKPSEYYEWMKGGRDFYEKYMENCRESKHVSTGYGIGYLSREMLMYLSQMNDSNGSREGKPIVIDNDEFYDTLNKEADPSVDGTLRAKLSDAVSMISGDGSSLLLNIDVSTPDEILLSEFKRLIPIWRKELKVEMNPSIGSSWAVVHKKIIDYKVIPYIDLTIWAYANRVTIPHGIMAIALFPCGERDLFSITQTIKPFVETLMTFESLEKMKREISK